MEGQLGQSNPSLGHAGVFGKIANKFLQRFRSFLIAPGRLQQTFLQSQAGARFFITALFFEFVVIGHKAGVIS